MDSAPEHHGTEAVLRHPENRIRVLPSSFDVPPLLAIKENVPAFSHYTIYKLEDKVNYDRPSSPWKLALGRRSLSVPDLEHVRLARQRKTFTRAKLVFNARLKTYSVG